jgi:hypothetical protein
VLELPVKKRSRLVGCEICLLVTDFALNRQTYSHRTISVSSPLSLVFDFTLASRSEHLRNITAPHDRLKVKMPKKLTIWLAAVYHAVFSNQNLKF